MVDKSDEDEEETQVEQTSTASLAWVLDTCAEAVVELTDAEDFADACIATGPAHHGRLMTGAATRLLLRENRERVIAQGSGWAENEKPFELTVSQHLAAVREWIAFEEDGRGTSADRWIAEDIERLQGKRAQYPLIRRVPDRFTTEPADPRRAAALARLEATVYCHGALHVPATREAYERNAHSDEANNKETSVLLSLGDGAGGPRTLFLCSASEGNTCNPGCWCAGYEMYSVHALIPLNEDEEWEEEWSRETREVLRVGSEGVRTTTPCWRHRRAVLRGVGGEGEYPCTAWENPETGRGWVRVLTYDYTTGNHAGLEPSGLHAATPSQAASIAARLGVDASDFGAAIRLVVLAANVKGKGWEQWDVVERAHRRKPGKFSRHSFDNYRESVFIDGKGWEPDGYAGELDPRYEYAWPDDARSGDGRVRRVCGGGAVNTFPRVNDSEHKTPQYSRRAPGPTEAEAPRGVLKRLMRKVSKIVTPAAVESLPRLVAALCGSEYLSEVMDAVQEAYYRNHLENHERWAAGYMERTGWLIPPPLYPEEWEHWCYEIPHTIS